MTPSVLLYRRVYPGWVKRNEATGALVLGDDGLPLLQSWAFNDLGDGVSVVLSDLLEQDGRTPEQLLVGYEDHGLTRLKIEDVQAIDGLTVEPKPEPHEPAHGEILGKKTGGRKNQLRELACWEIPVPR